MKKLLLSLSILLSVCSFAQISVQVIYGGNTVVANGTINAATTANGNTKIILDIKNNSSSTKSYNTKRYDVMLHTALSTTASAYFCFAGSCYGAATTGAGPLSLTAGQSASGLTGLYNMLVSDLDEASSVGLSVVKYSFINATTISDSVQVTLVYNGAAGLQVNNDLLSSFELSPNPVAENATIKINSVKAMDGKFTIINALGAVVSEKSISLSEGKNKIDFSSESLSSGIYFASLKFGSSSTTKKFVVK